MHKAGVFKAGKLVEAFGGNVFAADGSVVLCKLCCKSFPDARKFTLDQHVKSKTHQDALKRQEASKGAKQQLLTASMSAGSSKRSDFFLDLCRAFTSADIPLHKLSNKRLRDFFEKYMNRPIPDRTTLQKNYVPLVYEETLSRIRAAIGASNIWISIDETTDSGGRYVANVIVGELKPEEPGQSYLLMCEVLEKANSTTIAQLFCQSLQVLWGAVHHDRVLLFVTDAAPYMKKAGDSLKVLFPKMLHITCLAHGVHRVCEDIRSQFPEVDELVSNMKKVFVKAPSRVQAFKAALEIPLPPEPVLTRWGTWINAVCYYSEHFEALKQFVCNELDSSDAAAIGKAQKLFEKRSIRDDIAFIVSNFGSLPGVIERLESAGLALVDAVNSIDALESRFDQLQGGKGYLAREKLRSVLSRNTDFKELRIISRVLSGDGSTEELSQPDRFSVKHLACLKYARVVSCDVERSFSAYKTIYRDNRHSLLFENLAQYVVISCNQ